MGVPKIYVGEERQPLKLEENSFISIKHSYFPLSSLQHCQFTSGECLFSVSRDSSNFPTINSQQFEDQKLFYGYSAMYQNVVTVLPSLHMKHQNTGKFSFLDFQLLIWHTMHSIQEISFVGVSCTLNLTQETVLIILFSEALQDSTVRILLLGPFPIQVLFYLSLTVRMSNGKSCLMCSSNRIPICQGPIAFSC